MTILYALGWTQHSVGAQIIRTGAMVQLLLGNIGMAGGGMNALRGHSNIQGLTDLGLLSNPLPGYLTLPGEAEQDYDAYIAKRTPKPLRPGQLSYWQNYPKFHVSLMKAWFGKPATKENNWCYDWLPKLDMPGAGYDVLRYFDMMDQGKVNGYICQGFNPVASFPNKAKVGAALAKLKWLVIMDPLDTETSEFWQNHGEYNDVDPPGRSRPRCSACPPPASPRRTARSSTPAAGCSGTGRAPSRRAKRAPTSRSWPGCSIACAKPIARTAASSQTRSWAWTGRT